MKISRVLIRGFIVVMMVALAGCRSQADYYYLMTHADALKSEVKRCEQMENNSVDATCEMVRNAESDFEAYIAEERSDPQAYGNKIMLAQTQLGVLYHDMAELRGKPNLDLVKLKLAGGAYRQQMHKIRIMWNVIAVTNWE